MATAKAKAAPKKRKDVLDFKCYITGLDGVTRPFDELRPEERQSMSERLSRVMSEYYSKHLDEFEKL